MKPLTRINPLDMALILLLFEGATLSILALIGESSYAMNHVRPFFGKIVSALLVGGIGTVVALGVWHALRLKIRGTLGTEAFSLTRIGIVKASLANAVFLFVLWTMFDWLSAVRGLGMVGISLLGFLGTALATFILFFLYNIQPVKLDVRMNSHTKIIRVTPIQAAILCGIYEAVILPIMALLFSTLTLPPLATYAITGSVSGFVGGLVGTFIFNLVARYVKPQLDLR